MKNGDDQQIRKLQKEMRQLEEQISLEQKQKDIIKDYKMCQGNYQIIIKIYEASDLEPRQSKIWFLQKTACDSFVQIQIRDKKMKTNVRKQTNNPIFDERFCFKFEDMTLEQLDRSFINFKVYDRKTVLGGGEIIGSFELDWTNVYFKRNHQIYRGWLTLMDPYDQALGTTGYLLVDVAVLGLNDKVTVHDSAFIKDPLTTMQDTITMPKLQLIDYAITIDIYRGQNLIPLDEAFGNVDAYVIAKFSGNKVQSSTKHSSNPQWDQQITIGTGVPTKSKYIFLQVRNKNYLTKDDIIGIIKIPFIDLKETSSPQWGHLYGPPMSGKDKKPYNYATKMQLYGQQIGSHYRGRILYQITGHKDRLVKNKRHKINFKFPFKPTPVVPLKTYTLRIDLLNGFDLPEVKDYSYVHASIGQYILCSKQFLGYQHKCVQFLQRMDEKKLHFPQDFLQIPDLIIYFCNGKKQKNRISYVRIKAWELFNQDVQKNFSIYTLKGDLSLDNISANDNGGYIKLRAFLFPGLAPQTPKITTQIGQKYEFILKSFIYRGKGFPPMNQRGDCDAYVDIVCSGSQARTKTISSYNPVWNELKQFRIQTYNVFGLNMDIGLICTVYDEEDRDDKKMIGNFMVKLSRQNLRKFQTKSSDKIEFIFCKPKWYPVTNNKIDVGDPCVGHVLYGCALFKVKHAPLIKDVNLLMGQQKRDKKILQLFLIGIRQMKSDNQYISHEKIQLKVSLDDQASKQDEKEAVKQLQSSKISVKEGCVHFNQMLGFNLNIPRNKCLTPFIDIKLFRNTQFYAYSSISLYDVIPKLKQNKQKKKQNIQIIKDKYEQSEQQTILDVENLQKQLQIIREQKKLKQARERAERDNQAYLDKDLTKLVPPLQLGGVSTTDDSQKNSQLDRLLMQSMKEHGFKAMPNFNFAREQEKRKDKEREQMRSSASFDSKRDHKQQILYQSPKKPQNKKFEQHHTIDNIKSPQINQSSKHILPKKQKQLNKMREFSEDENEKEEEQKKFLPKAFNKKQQRQIDNQLKYNNGQQIVRDSVDDLHYRFTLKAVASKKFYQEEKTVQNFQIDQNEQISQVIHDQRAITYKDVERIIQLEEEHQKQARQRMENYKYAAAVKLSLFQYKKRKQDLDKQTYQDYDTDQDQDLDIIPQWYKGRKILPTDFQDMVHQKKKIKSLPIYRGGDRIGNIDIRQKREVANLRFVAISTDLKHAKQKQRYYQNLLKVKYFVCRIYILKGKSLISNFRGKPTTYLRITYRGIVHDLKEKTYSQEEYDPEYYICHELPMEIPGPTTVKIQVMQKQNGSVLKKSKVLGYTLIDMEQRYFMKKWHLFAHKKPIQLRNLYSQYGVGTQGRLQVWVDLIEKKDWLKNPPFKIHKPPHVPFQLRIIVWSTKKCVYKNQTLKSNDVFIRGFLGVSQPQQTDTHWACRGVGNFNYRFKFKANYPPKPEQMYSDQFIVQIWDRDVVGYNNLIGERRINLNTIHRLIQKAVKRRRSVKAKMKIREKSLILTDRFWFDVYNHKVKDQFGQLQSQGKVQLSFQLVPQKTADQQMKNGYGRSEPNVFPTLQQPSGRLNFNLFHPLDFFKQLCGPQLYSSLCTKVLCCFGVIIIGVLIYFIFGQLIATAIVGG